jgi:plastocyanin
MGIRRLLALSAAAFLALAAPAAAQATDLFATVGPEFTITLRDAQNQPVTKLDPGDYRIVVEDRSEFHNFHLKGPGVDVATDIEEIGTVEWNLTLPEGRYTFVCDPHASVMHGAFVVGNPPPLPVQLVATVGPKNTISLQRAGKKVTSLAAGSYVIVVRDRSKKHNFHLLGPGINRKTTVAGRGTVTWNLTLGAGKFSFRSDPQARRLKGSFTVTA